MKILRVDKGFYISGGLQLFGMFKSLKHCMKACATSPTCFSGDYNPWLHKCYQHSNLTACDRTRAHPQYIHFSKVPCSKCSRLYNYSLSFDERYSLHRRLHVHSCPPSATGPFLLLLPDCPNKHVTSAPSVSVFRSRLKAFLFRRSFP